MTLRVAVVDDQALMRTGFAMILGAEEDIDVVGDADSRAVHLVCGFAAELLEDLDTLRDPGCTGGMALGLETTGWIDR